MKKFWVGLEEKEPYVYFSNYPDVYFDTDIYKDDFEDITGLKLKPGEIVQCELKVVKRRKDDYETEIKK